MKLIVTGATGFVGKEVVRLSLKRPDITAVVALSRTPLSMRQNSEDEGDISKLRNFIIDDYENYPDRTTKKFIEADACIW